MAIQMFNKQGDSIIVDNKDVHNHLKMGWTFQRPEQSEKPKAEVKKTSTKKVQQATTIEEPAESTLVLEAEATAEVIKPNKEEN